RQLSARGQLSSTRARRPLARGLTGEGKGQRLADGTGPTAGGMGPAAVSTRPAADGTGGSRQHVPAP
ncbi:hypothetical protein ACPCK1_30960, partial [Streptomyces pseudogriseolus]|uniref:hypothetical protein n=1 Tax=Streptomyces pseudogriseolus TaxID=36817 RepID=UPI003FA317A8